MLPDHLAKQVLGCDTRKAATQLLGPPAIQSQLQATPLGLAGVLVCCPATTARLYDQFILRLDFKQREIESAAIAEHRLEASFVVRAGCWFQGKIERAAAAGIEHLIKGWRLEPS